MIRLCTEMAPGSTTAHTVSIMPRLRMIRYRGIMPPEKNMVKVIRVMMTLRPTRSLRERG